MKSLLSRVLRTWRYVACAMAGFAAAPHCGAATPPSAEDFFRRPLITEAKLSPSGKQVAVLSGPPGGRVRLSVIPLSAPDKAAVVAGFQDADVRTVHWVNDQRLVFDLISGDPEEHDQFAPGLWAVNVDGSNLRRLVRTQYSPASSTGSHIVERALPWNHVLNRTLDDGSADVIVERWVYQDTRREFAEVSLLRLNTEDGASRALAPGYPTGALDWWVDGRGEPQFLWARQESVVRLFARNGSGAWDLLNEDKDGVTRPRLTPFQVDGTGQLYVLAADDNPARTRSLYRYRRADRRTETEPVVSLKGFDFDGSLVFDNGEKQLLGVHYESDAKGTVWLDPGLKALQADVDRQLPATVNRLSFCSRCTDRGATLLVRSESDRQSPIFWLYDSASRSLSRLGTARPWIDARQMAERDFVRIRARDDQDLPVWITRPRGTGPWPTVVLVHGGPWARGGHWQWEPQSQFLASRGYLVVEPEFRGSAGYGTKHLEAGFQQWGLAMQDDVADATRWAIAKGMAQAGRVCIAGASYGGYASLMGLLRDPDLYRCGVDRAGPTDLGLMYSISWSDLSHTWERYGLPVVLGDPVRDAARFEATSPLKQAARIRQPLLLAYGGADRRVPLPHGKQFHEAVSATNHDVEWVVYASEGHGFASLANEVDFWQRVERFLARHLSAPPTAQPVSAAASAP